VNLTEEQEKDLDEMADNFAKTLGSPKLPEQED
jgi:hypothetical protein